jgi:hypothetical protein
MNKEAIELVKQYVLATVSGDNTINKDAYDLLTHMLRVDRNLATALCEVYDQIEPSGPRYQIPVDYKDELDGNDGYEH